MSQRCQHESKPGRSLSGRAALALSVVAVVVAMSGTAIAATGGSFILGRGNAETTTAGLTNTAGIPLSLAAKTGYAPLAVNSTVKVARLNADLLDGVDSSLFLRSTATAVNATKLGGQTLAQVKSGLAITPAQLATLRWDKDPTKPGTYGSATGSSSQSGVAFDGTHVWVANSQSNTVSVLNQDGSHITGSPFTAENNPCGIAFDGAHMWVANAGSNTVSVFNLDGSVAGSYATGSRPVGVAFDGTHMWVTNYFANTVSVFNLDGTQITGSPFATGTGPNGVAFDGTNVWVANSGTASPGTVTKFSLDGATAVPYATGGDRPQALAFDGAHMWVTTDNVTNDVTEFNLDGSIIGLFSTPGSYATAIAFDGAHMWVGDDSTHLSEFGGDGSLLRTFPQSVTPTAIAFDGTNMWATSGGFQVIKFRTR
ncbi:unannotated protein [freshwater metagenome]|uniref:Unannotated protein n=1 Tax=freshwater metagenome TaxID=449393 RepID=A0A6J7BKI4_9ZZZZ|nr:hypothetical protein [Actinomycetota bacterium]